MARSNILSDAMVLQLVAVGQVDILVGLPTFNNASTVAAVVKTLHVGLAKHFPRERTVLINTDGGSDDGTPDRVRNAPMADEEMAGSSTLRTTHRVIVPYSGLPGRAQGMRAVFAAADLLQARVVVMADPNVTSMTSAWVAELARPVLGGASDLVLPIHPRHRFEGPLLNQLVRPMMGTAYARRLRSNPSGDFGCSGRFAARLVSHSMWEHDLTRPALDVWMVATALAEDLRIGQVHLGPCHTAPRATSAGLPELFEQVVGTLFACLDHHDATWLPRSQTQDIPVLGEPCMPEGREPMVDVSRFEEHFCVGVRDLAPLLRDILAPETLARLQAAAVPGDGVLRIPDPLWVTCVYEFAASAHRGVMNREHLTQALIPLYLGRTASFFSEVMAGNETTYAQRLAALEREYEDQRPHFVERWNAAGRR